MSPHGIWLYAKGQEHFLPYGDFPWFTHARLSEIHHVKRIHGRFLRWEDLDVDLALQSLEDPGRFPLKSK